MFTGSSSKNNSPTEATNVDTYSEKNANDQSLLIKKIGLIILSLVSILLIIGIITYVVKRKLKLKNQNNDTVKFVNACGVQNPITNIHHNAECRNEEAIYPDVIDSQSGTNRFQNNQQLSEIVQGNEYLENQNRDSMYDYPILNVGVHNNQESTFGIHAIPDNSNDDEMYDYPIFNFSLSNMDRIEGDLNPVDTVQDDSSKRPQLPVPKEMKLKAQKLQVNTLPADEVEVENEMYDKV
jgi:hypothetical protein